MPSSRTQFGVYTFFPTPKRRERPKKERNKDGKRTRKASSEQVVRVLGFAWTNSGKRRGAHNDQLLPEQRSVVQYHPAPLPVAVWPRALAHPPHDGWRVRDRPVATFHRHLHVRVHKQMVTFGFVKQHFIVQLDCRIIFGDNEIVISCFELSWVLNNNTKEGGGMQRETERGG